MKSYMEGREVQMTIKTGFMLRTIAGSNIVVPVGDRSREFNGMITLNETGAFLCKRLEQGATMDELVAAILENYEDVDRDVARKSAENFVNKLHETGCIE